MRLAVINCALLALSAAALAEEPRQRRHLHQLKEMIINKLFSGSEPNCTQPTEPPPLQTKFFRIPGFNNVVIKAVPKGSSPEPAPVYEDQELPPNSQIGIVGSYLGTNTLNETYNALLGVKNLLTSGILNAKRDVLQEISLPHPPKVQVIATAPNRLIKPCAAPGLGPLPVEPVRVIVRPPKIPAIPTQYSYKQVNQDGSLTSYTSALDLGNGVRVIEDGRTVPFIIDRVQKIPVRLPVPVLPEVSKIIVSEAVHPSTYFYQQIHQDGRMTSYMGLPTLVSMPGPVVVTEAVKGIPPPPVYLMDRIEKVATIASFPRAPLIASKPTFTGYVPNAPVKASPEPKPLGYFSSQMNINGQGHASKTTVKGGPVPEPGPMGYSYSQMTVNGGMTTHSASGANGAVQVTENGLPAAPLNAYPSLPEKNPYRTASGYGFSYKQVHGGGQTTSFNGVQEGSVNVIEHRPAPSSVPLPPNSFSYKQIGDGKMITYYGSGIMEQSYGGKPDVIIHGMDHPVPPPHITERIEKVAGGAKFNRPPFPPPMAVPIPTGFVHIPPVQTLVPQRPVKIPILSRPSSFMYKHIHSDGSVTRYGGEGFVEDGTGRLPPPADMARPFPQGNIRIIESDNGPFPMNPVNPNAFKPSTPVSGSYSYKLVNHPPVGPIEEPIVDTFAPPPPLQSIPASIQGCVEPDPTNPINPTIDNPMVGPSPVLFERPIPLTYSYKQISHSNPNPFLVVNVEDPVRDVKKVNMKLINNDHAHAPLPPPPPPVAFPTFVQPPPFVPPPIVHMPVPQAPAMSAPPSSFSYKQVSSHAYQPPLLPHAPVDFRPNVFVPPQANDMHLTNVQKETSPSSSFSYKQVTSQTLPPQRQPSDNVMENKPSVQNMPFAPPLNSAMHSTNVPSSFSYKQVTSQENQTLLPSPQPADNDMEYRPSAPPVPPPAINSRGPQIYKDNAPSSFSYKQVTNQGVYEYSDEFPSGIKTNMHSNPSYPERNPSGDVYVEQKPLPNPTISRPIPASQMPIPSRQKPTFERRNSLSNNPIVVPELSEQSSFSFKSSNADGSTITVMNGGHNSVAVQLEEAPKVDSISNSQEPTIPAPPAPIANEEQTESAFLNESTTAPEKVAQGPVSGHAKPLRRRVIKRVRPVKQHRGDIPDSD